MDPGAPTRGATGLLLALLWARAPAIKSNGQGAPAHPLGEDSLEPRQCGGLIDRTGLLAQLGDAAGARAGSLHLSSGLIRLLVVSFREPSVPATGPKTPLQTCRPSRLRGPLRCSMFEHAWCVSRKPSDPGIKCCCGAPGFPLRPRVRWRRSLHRCAQRCCTGSTKLYAVLRTAMLIRVGLLGLLRAGVTNLRN